MNTDSLQVGSRVLVGESYGWNGRRHKPGTVTKKTPSGIVTVMIDAYPPHGTIAHEKKFKASGWEWGRDNYRGDCLQEYSAELLEQEAYQSKVDKARRFLEDSATWVRKLTPSATLALSDHIKELIEASK